MFMVTMADLYNLGHLATQMVHENASGKRVVPQQLTQLAFDRRRRPPS